MKRYLSVVLAVILVLGFSASAFAIHASIPAETTPVVAPKGTDIRLGGEIRIRGWYEDNITDPTGVKALVGRPYNGGSMSWYDQRVRLAIDARVAPNVTGRVHLETNPTDTGNRGENWNWGTTSTVDAVGDGGEKRGTSLNILEAWIAYTDKGLLGVPAGIKVGHMPVVIGEGTFFDHRRYGDDAIVLWIEPAKGTEISLLTAKLFEGALTTDNTDDVDLYSLMLTHKLDKDNTLGVNYSIVTVSDMDGLTVAGYRLPGVSAQYANANGNLSNLGVFLKGKIAGLGYKATADFQFGKIKEITGLPTEQKFSGYGITAGVDYKLDPVTLRANFVYGSGDSDATSTAGNTKNKAFQTFVGNVIDPNLPTVVYNFRVDTAAGSGIRGTGIANTTAYNLGLTYSPIKDMTAHLDYYLLRASKALATTGYGSDKKIGSEVDLKVSYRLARNLTYFINSGILFAGDFYRAAPGPATDPKNAIVFHHGLTLSF